jgi:hypothetical protein
MNRRNFFAVIGSLLITLAAAEQKLPAEFLQNQIFLKARMKDGRELKIFTDTGGGWNAIAKDLYEHYRWPHITKVADGNSVNLSVMPEFDSTTPVPPAGINNFMQGYLFIVDRNKIAELHEIDMFLGGRWHAEKTLQFNYIRQELLLLEQTPKDVKQQWLSIPLGFQKNNDGNYTTAFASIDIKVGEDVFPMLLDTGASAKLTRDAKQVLNTQANVIGTSYIVGSVFDTWRKQHPDWRVIEKGDSIAFEPMIEVPRVTLGDKTVGPVWFTRRSDHHFHQFMSRYMDRKVDGAIGGSMLQYLNIIVDYPNEMAYIEPSSLSPELTQ